MGSLIFQKKKIGIFFLLASELYIEKVKGILKKFKDTFNNSLSEWHSNILNNLSNGIKIDFEKEYNKLDDWEFYLHGEQIKFVNKNTKEVIDIDIGLNDKIDGFSGWMVLQFINSVPNHNNIIKKINNTVKDDYSKMIEIIEFLEEKNYIQKLFINNNFSNKYLYTPTPKGQIEINQLKKIYQSI